MTAENISILQIAPDIKAYCKKVNNIQELKNQSAKSAICDAYESKIITCKLPLGMEVQSPKDEFFFFGCKAENFNVNFPLQTAYIASFPYCQLISNSFIILTNDNYLLKQSYFNDKFLTDTNLFMQNSLKLNIDGVMRNIPFALYRKFKEPELIEKNLFLMVYHWHFNYHHWLTECLPRLRYIIESNNFEDCKIIVPEKMNNFQLKSLELLDIPTEKLFYYDGKPTEISKLFFPSLGNFSPEELKWIREKFFKKLNIKPTPKRLIYISRSDADKRKVINEPELIEFLKGQGFEIYTLTGMEFQEQIKLFSEAKVVIGPNGAGLTNIIFASEENLLVELMPNDEVNHSLWLLTSSLGQKYTYLVGENYTANRDFIVSIPKLESLLKSVM